MISNLCPQAWDLLTIFRSGVVGTGADIDVYEKGIRLFSQPVSHDVEECIQFAISNNVAVWDLFPETEATDWEDQVNDLWVSFLCREAVIP